ncbi:hypothetical protein M8C21_003604, partial [Ambrosia artemisiifolia]
SLLPFTVSLSTSLSLSLSLSLSFPLSLNGPSSPSVKDCSCLRLEIGHNMGSKTDTWSDQWGTGVFDNEEKGYEKQNNKSNNNKKMEQVKAVASTGLVKAKSAAVVGASKVKKVYKDSIHCRMHMDD